MAAKIAQVSGSYDKKVEDSGDGCCGGAKQASSKFSTYNAKPKLSHNEFSSKGSMGMDVDAEP